MLWEILNTAHSKYAVLPCDEITNTWIIHHLVQCFQAFIPCGTLKKQYLLNHWLKPSWAREAVRSNIVQEMSLVFVWDHWLTGCDRLLKYFPCPVIACDQIFITVHALWTVWRHKGQHCTALADHTSFTKLPESFYTEREDNFISCFHFIR